MRFLLYCKNEVPLGQVRNLFGFSFKDNCVSVCHTSFNVNCKLLIIIDKTHSSAVWALSCHCLALTSASWALSLHLHLHSESHLNILHNNTSSSTLIALFKLAIFCSRASALVTIDIPINIHDSLATIVHLL